MRTLSAALLLVTTLLTGQALAAGTMAVETLAERIDAGTAPLIIDVRSEDEYLAGHVPGAQLIPHDQMASYVDSLATEKNRDIVLYCRSGRRAGLAAETLEAAGFSKVQLLDGSFQAWSAAGKPVK